MVSPSLGPIRTVLIAALAGLCLPWSVAAQTASNDTDVRVLRWPVQGKGPVLTAVQLQPGGDLIAAAGDTHVIQVWNRHTGRPKWRLAGHNDWVRSLSISPDGRTLASGGNDGRVLLWNLESGEQLAELAELSGAIRTVQFSRVGGMIAVCGFGEPLRLFHATTHEQLFQLACPCQDTGAVAFSPDDWLVAAGGRNGRVRIFDLRQEGRSKDYRIHQRRIRALAFHDANNIVSCGDDRKLRIWNRLSEQERAVVETPAKLYCLASIGGDRMAVGGSDNLIRVIDLNTRKVEQRFAGHAGTVAAISFDGAVLASCGFDTTVRIRPLEATQTTSLELEADDNRDADETEEEELEIELRFGGESQTQSGESTKRPSSN